jgi:prepilin-type N-terminal cleavage/methylation domain-containing protein
MKNKSGFTLIEVLVVIFIIGLLASVVLVGLGTFRARGRDARRIADLRSMQNILELYYAKNGVYPDAITSWAGLESTLKSAGIGVSNIPEDPIPSETYHYGASPSNQSYVLSAKIEDSDHRVLNDDIDNDPDIDTYNVDCSGSNYCIKF